LFEALGLSMDDHQPHAPESIQRAPLEAYPIRTRAPSLGIPLEIDEYIEPEHGGDFFLIVPVAATEVLVAAVDVAGNGPSAMPAARYLQGWLRGRAMAPGAPRLDRLASDLHDELEFTGIEAAWYLALLQRQGSSTLLYQAVADSFPDPLLLVDEAGTTRPSVAKRRSDGSFVLELATLTPPCTLALASDGMLRRLGGGDEHRGKGVIRRWLTGERRRQAIQKHFGKAKITTADESLAVLRWSPWDERYVFNIADSGQRHACQQSIRLRAQTIIGPHVADLGRALAEALNNVWSHAYGGADGPAEVYYRASSGRVELEVRDHGTGALSTGDGVRLIHKSCTAQLFRGPENGHVVYLRCDAEQDG
jgi:hypothetical protein